ncbi:hypothetical protein [Spirosoma luteolum]
MAKPTDYSKLTVDELLASEAKIKKQRVMWALVIGSFVGVVFWAVMHHASFFKVILLILFFGGLAGGGKKNEENFKAIESELRSRGIR